MLSDTQFRVYSVFLFVLRVWRLAVEFGVALSLVSSAPRLLLRGYFALCQHSRCPVRPPSLTDLTVTRSGSRGMVDLAKN